MIDPQADAMNKAMNAGPPLDQVGLEQSRQWIAEHTPVADTEVAKVVNLTTGGENGVDVPACAAYLAQASESIAALLTRAALAG
jgi:hypothetical protein